MAKVLVAHSDSSASGAIVEIVTALGHDVVVSGAGEDAFSALADNPDLGFLIVDVVSSAGQGELLIQTARSLRDFVSTPILVCIDEGCEPSWAYGDGPLYCLTGPLSEEEVKTHVLRFVEGAWIGKAREEKPASLVA